MEEPSPNEETKKSPEINNSKIKNECISSNWVLAQDNKSLSDVVSLIESSKASKILSLEEIATEFSCVVLQPANENVDGQQETCIVDINLDGQKMLRIGVVSEASVLEFFKESGEYAGTVFAEFIDEFDGATVYIAQLNFERPTSQFTRIHNSRSNMYLYGMKLVIADEKNSPPIERLNFRDIKNSNEGNNGSVNVGPVPNFANIADHDGNFTTDMDACLRSFMELAWITRDEKPSLKQDATVAMINPGLRKEITESVPESPSNIESYIDKKFLDMERRLMQRIDEAEAKMTEKLDVIIKYLDVGSKRS